MSNIPYESAVPGAGKFYRFQRALPGGRASLALWGFIAGIGALDYTWATQQAIGIDPAQIDARIRLGLITWPSSSVSASYRFASWPVWQIDWPSWQPRSCGSRCLLASRGFSAIWR